MAKPIYTSNFPDSRDSRTNWPALITGDQSDPSQLNATTESIIEMQKQMVVGGDMELWWQWDPTIDKSLQFGAKVEGANVSSSIFDQVSYLGLEWIRVYNATGGSGTTFIDTGTFVPILATPPTGNYLVMAEFLYFASSDNDTIGAFVGCRFDGAEQGYWSRCNDRGSVNTYRVYKSTTGPVTAQIGVSMSDPDLNAAKLGSQIGIGAVGETLVQAQLGELQNIADTSSPITATGNAAIGSSTMGLTSRNVDNYFRNIRCYTLAE